MRIYFDTGTFIDYVCQQDPAHTVLRSAPRRGREPLQLAADAERVFKKTRDSHLGASSCLTIYEIEEALYGASSSTSKGVSRARLLLVAGARGIARNASLAVHRFQLDMLDLTPAIVSVYVKHPELQPRGIRAADAIHITTAIAFDADLFVTADDTLLKLDRLITNSRGLPIRCLDTDSALSLL